MTLYTVLIPLPTLRALTAELREINVAFAHEAGGAEYVALELSAYVGWRVRCVSDHAPQFGRELVPGGAPFDATAAARRLLAAARDGLRRD